MRLRPNLKQRMKKRTEYKFYRNQLKQAADSEKKRQENITRKAREHQELRERQRN
jgi:hypothetical protein